MKTCIDEQTTTWDNGIQRFYLDTAESDLLWCLVFFTPEMLIPNGRLTPMMKRGSKEVKLKGFHNNIRELVLHEATRMSNIDLYVYVLEF